RREPAVAVACGQPAAQGAGRCRTSLTCVKRRVATASYDRPFARLASLRNIFIQNLQTSNYKYLTAEYTMRKRLSMAVGSLALASAGMAWAGDAPEMPDVETLRTMANAMFAP